MKTDSGHPKARQYLENLAASSRYTFTTGEARTALGLSPPALKVALNRLARRRLIVSPVRGFHVIVPPEYRSLGSLPANQFVPALMTTLTLPYYAGLLTAAEYHGAAHQRPQEFQVLVEKARRRIECGNVRVGFLRPQEPAQSADADPEYATRIHRGVNARGHRVRSCGLPPSRRRPEQCGHGSLGACGEDRSRATREGGARRPGSVGPKARLPSGAGRSRWQDGAASAIRARARARIRPAPSRARRAASRAARTHGSCL